MVKVLFMQNLENHKVGEIKNVPDGYARNFLLPKNIAVIATDEEVKKQQTNLEKIKVEEEKAAKKLEETANKLQSSVYEIEAQAGDEDKLFGAITNRDIAELLNQKGFEIDKHLVEIPEPIHNLGEHTALVHLGHGVKAEISINVIRAS
jgi:large subunit ribosomal protein L9